MSKWLLVSDVDDTLLGDDVALARLMAVLAAANHITVAYNSSRPCASLRQSLAENPTLRPPDFLIGALGTEIEYGHSGEPVTEYTAYLSPGWQRQKVDEQMRSLGFVPHADRYQTPYKASYDIPDQEAYRQAQVVLRAADLPATTIFSGGKNLDVIPPSAGKGAVIQFLQVWLAIPADQVLVAGDSGNDRAMFISPYRGIVVGNADADLKAHQADHIYQAQATHAAGVLEGLIHWQVV
jgi:sucrose-6F-phosphate phosphohydrolase